ncbi:MAG: hypothetical protein R2864_05510 [Syntrophotaleaceae bacterium]
MISHKRHIGQHLFNQGHAQMADFTIIMSFHETIPQYRLEQIPATWRITENHGRTLLAVHERDHGDMQLDNHERFRTIRSSRCFYHGNHDLKPFWRDIDLSSLGTGSIEQQQLERCLALNGHFLLSAIDEHSFVAVTDAGGAVPLFFSCTDQRFVAGTNPNLVAILSDCDQPDPVSINDFLLHGSICHPHSWFKNVYVADPGTLLTFNCQTGKINSKPYWCPEQSPLQSLAGSL